MYLRGLVYEVTKSPILNSQVVETSCRPWTMCLLGQALTVFA